MAELEQSFDEHDMSEIPKSSQPDVDHVEPKNDSKPKEKQDNNDTVLVGGETRWPGWPGESVFRLLVPTQKVGGIIGHEGEFLKKMCEETRARIKILDGPHGIAESAVLVSAKEEPDASVPPAVAGLLSVHKRVVDGLESDPSPAPPVMGSKVSTRLLVLAAQAESLADKSIQEASGCTVRVLGTDDLLIFALQDDKIVEIVGEPLGVHKAVELIASHLRKFLVDTSVIPNFEIQMQMPNPHYMPPPRKYDYDYPPADMPPPMEKQLHHDISASEVRTAPQLIGSKVAKMDSPLNAQPAPSMITQDQYPLQKDGSMLPYVLYHLQYMKTGGYDVDELPDEWKFPGQSIPECPTDEHKELCEWAIHDHYSNKGHKNEPEFVQVVKAMCEPCAGLNFYLTFKAKDKIDGKVETYQAIVYERFDSTRKLTEFRVKPPGDVQGK